MLRAVILVLLLCISSAHAAEFDVFVNGGQSNMMRPAIWAAFRSAYPRPVEFVNCAVGSTAQSERAAVYGPVPHWDESGTLVPDCFAKVDAAMAAWIEAGDVPHLRGVNWLQGEYEAIVLSLGATDLKTYENALVHMIARFDARYAVPFYIFRVGALKGQFAAAEPWAAQIRECQEDVARNNSRVRIVFRDNANYPALGLMADDLHYTPEGDALMGRKAATVIANGGR